MSDSSRWQRPRPDINLDSAADILEANWLVQGELTELGSQQDRTYLVAGEERFVLKVENPVTTAVEIDAQHYAARRLDELGISVPLPIPTRKGHETVELSEGTARLQNFLAGGTLADLETFDETAARALGDTAGAVVAGLAEAEHPGFTRDLQWDLRNAAEVIEQLIDDVTDVELNQRVRAATKDATAQLSSLSGDLPVQPIHGDLTDDNVIRTSPGTLGVIDLGDVGHGWRVAELAVTIASVLQRTGSLSMAAVCAAEFAAHVELTDSELAALHPLIVLRGATLVVSGWNQLRIDASNDYAAARIESEQRAFDVATAIAPELFAAVIRTAIGRPHAPGAHYAPLVAGDRNATVLDLGPESSVFHDGGWQRPDAVERAVGAALKKHDLVITQWGAHRLDRASAPCPAAPQNRTLFVEFIANETIELCAPFDCEIEPGGDFIDLVTEGVRLRVSGAEAVAETHAAAGAAVGAVKLATSGRARARVQWIAAEPNTQLEWCAAGDTRATDLRPDPSILLGVAPAPSAVAATRREVARRDRVLGAASERYWQHPPLIVRGWKQYLIDVEGRPLLDLVNNVTAVGHSHPEIERAASRALKLLNTNSRFLYREYADFVERLVDRANRSWPGKFDVAVPVNSGSEAVDLALRMARVFTGRRDVLVPREAYHGWTFASDAVSTSAFDNPHAADSRPEWVHLAEMPNPYRGRYRGPASGTQYAADVRQQLSDLAAAGHPVGAFICEPVLGNAGGVVPPAGYLPDVYEAVREQGGLAIADEVQVGYGRLGSHWFGAELNRACPDIITVAKAAGNAYPLGAVITRREVLDALAAEGMFFASAAGTPLSSAVGSAVLNIVEREGLQDNARRVGEHFSQRMHELAQRHPSIGAVHGTGLYQGIEIVRNRESLEPASAEVTILCERMLAHGMIVQPASERQNVLKFKPPMTITTADIDAFAAALDTELVRLEAEGLRA